MKRKLWLFLLLLTGLCLFAACAGPGPEPQPDPVPPPEETVEPRLAYTFPPDEAQLKQVLDDLGLNWSFQEPPAALGKYPQNFVLHILSNDSGLVNIWLNMQERENCPNMDTLKKRLFVQFDYDDWSKEEIFRDFREKDWPSAWSLAGELLVAQEEVAALKQACMEYFSALDRSKKIVRDLAWYGKQGDIYCCVDLLWGMHLPKHELYNMAFWEDPELPQHFMHDEKIVPKYLATVEEIGLSIPPEQEEAAYFVQGRLEQLQPVEDKSSGFAQQGLLVDESGSVPVFVITTWLSQEELTEERVVTVTYINTDQPYCVVDPNQGTAEVSRFKNK